MRFCGSKWKLSAHIVRHIPPGVRHYVEPFAGTAAVFRRIMMTDWISFDSCWLNDACEDVHAWLRMIRGDDQEHGDFVDRLADVRKRFLPEKDHEDEIRDHFERCKVLYVGHDDPFAWFFLHLYAVGQYVFRPFQRANVASFDPAYLGSGVSTWTIAKAQLWRTCLLKAKLTCRDGLDVLANLPSSADQFVYVDPPYILKGDSTFNMYTRELSLERHEELADILRHADFRWVLSIGDSPDSRRLYMTGDFNVLPRYCAQRSRHRSNKAVKGKEWLIKNF